MNLHTLLSGRLTIEDIREVLQHIRNDRQYREEVYRLIFDKDDFVAYQALWICTHFPDTEIEWMHSKQDELTAALFACPHSGKRRLMLNLLYRQPVNDPPRMDLLDFCLERMMSRQEPVGVQSICMKLAYKLTHSIPELQQELRLLLEMMEPELLSPALRSSRKNVLKKLVHRKGERKKGGKG